MIKNRKVKAIICGLVLTLGATIFAGCGNNAVEDGGKNTANNNTAQEEQNKNAEGEKQEDNTAVTVSKIDEIKKAGKLVLGTCADYPPYEFIVMKDGKEQIVGFDIEIAREIAKDLGVELEIKNMDFDGLIPSLKTGKVDFVISGMTPTPDRMEEVDFSKIYYKAVQSVIVRSGDENKYTTPESLSSVKIGAQTSSIQEEIAKEQIKATSITSLGKVTELVLSLKTKKVDAIVVEYPVAKSYVDKEKDIALANVTVGDPDGGSAIGIQKGNEDLVEAINKTLDKLMEGDKINELVAEASAIEQ